MQNKLELKAWVVSIGNFDPIKLDINNIKSKSDYFKIIPKTFLSTGIKGDIVDDITNYEWLRKFEQGIQITLYIEGSGFFLISNISAITKFIYLKSYRQNEKLKYDFSKAFIIMSMSNNKELDDVKDSIELSLKEASKELKIPEIQCMRVDDIKGGSFKIDEAIFTNIEKSGIVICDLTEEKPNCYYELAWAMAFKRKVIITAKKETKIHFDVSHWNIRFWENHKELKSYIIDDVKSIINEVIINQQK